MDTITKVLDIHLAFYHSTDHYCLCERFVIDLLKCRPSRIKLKVSDTPLPGLFKFDVKVFEHMVDPVVNVLVGDKTHYLTRTLREWFIARVPVGTTKTFYAKIWKLKN